MIYRQRKMKSCERLLRPRGSILSAWLRRQADEARLKVILDGASGFLYYVSITGVTGAAVADVNALKPHVEMIKGATDLPVAIGFGIKTPEDAALMGEIGDAVVVGSAIVDKIKNIGDNSANKNDVVAFVRSLSDVLRA